MGMCLDGVGKMAVEVRRESFIVHPSYGYKGEGDGEEHDDSSTFLTRWREGAHPEFMLCDLDDLISALVEAREYLKKRSPDDARENPFRSRTKHMKRWRVDTQEGKTFIVYGPTMLEAVKLVNDAGLGCPSLPVEAGSFEDGVLTIPDNEMRLAMTSVQYGPVKPAKGRRG